MKFTVLTLFPQMMEAYFNESILKRAQNKDLVEIEIVYLRNYAIDTYGHVDGAPYSEATGMVLRVDVAKRAIDDVSTPNSKVAILTPVAPLYTQHDARNIAETCDHLILLCGHYEGYDARIYDYCDYRFCIGDYILTGGELGAMVIVDSITRLIPGVINAQSLSNESFSADTLEYDQFTRPLVFDAKSVPYVLTNGNHGKIQQWKRYNSLVNTKKFRKDMWNAELERELNQLCDNQASFMESKED